MAKIVDVTQAMKAPGIDWSLTGEPFAAQFPRDVQSIRVGLYAAVHVNDSPHPIYDRNRNGEGKVIVSGSSSALKYGKFESGLVQRNLVNHKHFHRKLPTGAEDAGIFVGVLRLLLVFDLTDVGLGGLNPAAVFEPYWNRSIEHYVTEKQLLHPQQGKRSESRNLVKAPDRHELDALLSDIADRVLKAAEVLRPS